MVYLVGCGGPATAYRTPSTQAKYTRLITETSEPSSSRISRIFRQILAHLTSLKQRAGSCLRQLGNKILEWEPPSYYQHYHFSHWTHFQM